MTTLAWKNLFHDRVRLVVTLTGIVFALVLIIVQFGLFLGFLETSANVVANSGADLWIGAPGIPHVNAGAPMLEKRRPQTFEDFRAPRPLPEGSVLVLGIPGGWERWDAEAKLVGRLAASLRKRALPGVFVEMVENRHMDLAERLVREAFPQPAKAGVILYGHSMGGAAAVRFARRLRELGFPAQLLIAADSWGRGDGRVPDNVAVFGNIFQTESFPVRGQRFLLADDPLQSRSLGNFEFSYKGRADRPKIAMTGEPAIRRWWLQSHLTMEYDPEVERLADGWITGAIERWCADQDRGR